MALFLKKKQQLSFNNDFVARRSLKLAVIRWGIFAHRIPTYRVRITTQLTSCFICLDRAALLLLNKNKFTCLVECNPAKQLVSRTVILPL